MYCNDITRILREDLRLAEQTFDEDTNLFEAGLMDSLATMHLFIRLEEKYGVVLDLAEVEIEDFATVRKINQYIKNNK